MLRLYGFPGSTNYERVVMALRHKGLEFEDVDVPFDDRSEVRAVSGQDLVPVLVDGETVVHDSPVILQYLDRTRPDTPLYPADPARRAEVEVFIDWFNRVWKVPPNAIEAELGKESPDAARIDAWSREMRDHLARFEALLQGRPYLMGHGVGAADFVAFPFLRYAAIPDGSDDYLFHEILVEHMPLDGRYPRLRGWIEGLWERRLY